MSNQIKLTIDISDELLSKAMQMIMLSGASKGGSMPLMAMLQGSGPEPTKENKGPMGFGRQDHAEKVAKTEKESQTTDSKRA